MAIRLDTVQAMDPGSPTPIGTLQEVRQMGLSPLKYGSCSMPGANNIGCKHFDDKQFGPCPILQLCRAKNRKGYERVAFVRILSPTVMKQDACACHQYMDVLAHADPRNGVTHILGLGGDVTIKRRGSVALDPNNPRSKSKTVLEVEKILPIERPMESMADRAATMQLARDLNAQEAKNAAGTLASLGLRNDSEPETFEEAEGLADEFDGEPDLGDESMLEDDTEGLGGDDDILEDETPEPPVVAAVSGKRRGRPRKNG